MNDPRDNWKSTAWITFAALVFMTCVLVIRESRHNVEFEEAVSRARAAVPFPNEYNEPFESDE